MKSIAGKPDAISFAGAWAYVSTDEELRQLHCVIAQCSESRSVPQLKGEGSSDMQQIHIAGSPGRYDGRFAPSEIEET
ncbi:MAG: hypothetical protein ONB12_08650 [candidate division KSB1 bacterium]|nr:hypothetical protein [candidate division KSB1 bacterium]